MIGNFFKKADYFAQPYQVKVLNHNSLQTILGACMSVIIFAVGLAVFITQADNLLNKKKPVVNRDVIYDIVPGRFSLDVKNFTMFSYYFTGDNKYLLDSTYFNLKISNFLQTRGFDDKGMPFTKLTRDAIPWEFCGNNLEKYLGKYNYFGNFTEILMQKEFKKHICLMDDRLNIGGDYNSNFFSNILFEITKCINSTANNNTCKSNAEINASVNGWNFEFDYIDHVTKTNDYLNPFQAFVTSYYTKLDATISQSIDVYFGLNQLFSDNGWIFEEVMSYEKFSFIKFREILSVNPVPGRVMRLYVNVSNNRSKVFRYYMKVQELAAIIGGIIKVCTVVAFAIVLFFTKYNFDEMLINLYFNIDEINKTDQKDKFIIPTIANKTLNLINIMNRNETNVNAKGSKKNNKVDKKSSLVAKIKNKVNKLKVNDENVLSDQKREYIKEKGFNLSYLDILCITICPCRAYYKGKKYQLENLLENLRSYTDFSEIVNQVIGFKYMKDQIFTYNSFDITGNVNSKKLEIDLNPYSLKDNVNLREFINVYKKLQDDYDFNENIHRKLLKVLGKVNKKDFKVVDHKEDLSNSE